jgi:hypothetical protein
MRCCCTLHLWTHVYMLSKAKKSACTCQMETMATCIVLCWLYLYLMLLLCNYYNTLLLSCIVSCDIAKSLGPNLDQPG